MTPESYTELVMTLELCREAETSIGPMCESHVNRGSLWVNGVCQFAANLATEMWRAFLSEEADHWRKLSKQTKDLPTRDVCLHVSRSYDVRLVQERLEERRYGG